MKKILTIVILALSLNAISQIPTNGLVGYWPFTGNANDLSGNGNNGTVNGATLTLDRFGNANSAYSFDGLTNYITLPNDPIFNTDKFSVSVWVKFGLSGAATPDLFMLNNGNDNSSLQWRIYNQGVCPTCDSSSLICDIFTNSGRIVTGKPIATNQWYNIIMTSDSLQLKCFVNGQLVNAKPILGIINKMSNDFTVGARFAGTVAHSFFIGEIDDIRIYDRALSDTDITSLFNESLCFQTITVTDTLIINVSLTGFNPVAYVNTIKVYPNPTSDKITIDCGNNYSTLNGYKIKITNSLSQTVYASFVTQQSTTIDLNSWTGTGIYFVHLIDANNNTIDIKKIILQ